MAELRNIETSQVKKTDAEVLPDVICPKKRLFFCGRCSAGDRSPSVEPVQASYVYSRYLVRVYV